MVTPGTLHRVADTAAVVSAGSTTWIFVGHLNEVLQLLAAAVAIISGLSAAYFYITRARILRKDK